MSDRDDSSSFDYIVIGAGSAGCVIANRLSEDPSASVLLLEAGGRDFHPGFRLPLLMGALINSGLYNWSYQTEPEPGLDNRRIRWPRGKVVGGTSTINGMVYSRGFPSDYDRWAAMGLEGWSYADVLPLFRKSEGHIERGGPLHGVDGPLVVAQARGRYELTDAFIAAGEQAGYPRNHDFNGETREGFGRYDFTVDRGRRCSTARAFLTPAATRPNLKVVLKALITRILFDGGRAGGVEYHRGGRICRATARREILLSAGAINSPQILMLSGIGDAEELTRHGIDVVRHLPGVGKNLQDHFDCGLIYECTRPVSLYRDLRVDRLAIALVAGLLLGRGPATIFPYEGAAFIRTRPELAEPDIQVHFMHGREDTAKVHWPRLSPGSPESHHGFTVRVSPVAAASRGTVSLRSADPAAAPVIRANYLSAPQDVETTVAGIKAMRSVVAQLAFDPYRGREIWPGPQVRSDSEIAEWLKQAGGTTFHPVGTCRMGLDEDAVVDARLRVHGVEGLRVADASVMPLIVSANTNAPTIMIGEKAAEMVRSSWS